MDVTEKPPTTPLTTDDESVSVKGQTADTIFPRDSEAFSPYRPSHLIKIFLRPRAFFSPAAALGPQKYLVLACWLMGTSFAITRVEQQLVKAEIGSVDLNLNLYGLLLTWPIFWPVVLVLGLWAGGLFWIVGGWWFRLRIKFSGDPNPDPRMSRLVMVYAGLVSALPHLVFVLWWTLRYENYLIAYAQELLLAVILFALSFVELFSAYRGVRKFFVVGRWRARLWFIILPALLYLGTFGLVAIIFAVL